MKKKEHDYIQIDLLLAIIFIINYTFKLFLINFFVSYKMITKYFAIKNMISNNNKNRVCQTQTHTNSATN